MTAASSGPERVKVFSSQVSDGYVCLLRDLRTKHANLREAWLVFAPHDADPLAEWYAVSAQWISDLKQDGARIAALEGENARLRDALADFFANVPEESACSACRCDNADPCHYLRLRRAFTKEAP